VSPSHTTSEIIAKHVPNSRANIKEAIERYNGFTHMDLKRPSDLSGEGERNLKSYILVTQIDKYVIYVELGMARK
jgi:hypothetical protein